VPAPAEGGVTQLSGIGAKFGIVTGDIGTADDSRKPRIAFRIFLPAQPGTRPLGRARRADHGPGRGPDYGDAVVTAMALGGQERRSGRAGRDR
jgi:hypothetical protein